LALWNISRPEGEPSFKQILEYAAYPRVVGWMSRLHISL